MTRYDSDNVPYLYLNDDEPALNANWNDNANPKWGAPSFGSVHKLKNGFMPFLSLVISSSHQVVCQYLEF